MARELLRKYVLVCVVGVDEMGQDSLGDRTERRALESKTPVSMRKRN